MEEIFKKQIWALDPDFFLTMQSIVTRAIESGRDLSFLKNTDHIKTIDSNPIQLDAAINGAFDQDLGLYIYQNSKTGKRVAEIGMVGALTKSGDLCAPGSLALAEQINTADANESIDGILLFVDGPGGSISGIQRLMSAIKDTKKPIVAYVDEMAASAHLFAIGGADYIVANANEYTKVGSLGVQAVLTSITDKLDKDGIKVRVLRADQSVDKNAINQVEPWPEEAVAEMVAEMTAINTEMIGKFKAGRGDRLNTTDEDTFTGKMYTADRAQELGLIDFQGDLAGAIDFVGQLSTARKIVNN